MLATAIALFETSAKKKADYCARQVGRGNQSLADDGEGRLDFIQWKARMLKDSQKASAALPDKTLEAMEAVEKSFKGTRPC